MRVSLHVSLCPRIKRKRKEDWTYGEVDGITVTIIVIKNVNVIKNCLECIVYGSVCVALLALSLLFLWRTAHNLKCYLAQWWMLFVFVIFFYIRSRNIFFYWNLFWLNISMEFFFVMLFCCYIRFTLRIWYFFMINFKCTLNEVQVNYIFWSAVKAKLTLDINFT